MAVYTHTSLHGCTLSYRLHGRTASEATSVVSTDLSLPTLSWSLTASLRQESSTMASGSVPGLSGFDDTIVGYVHCKHVILSSTEDVILLPN